MVEYKQSDIDHHEAGDGIFVKTHNSQSLLPGTLLGFYPGVIRSRLTPKPEQYEEFVNYNTRRYDSFWIDSEAELPYPTKENLSIEELHKRIEVINPNIDTLNCIECIDPEYLNPYAIGHKINHPPPGMSANTELIDFDIPYTWFPQEYRLHLPYADEGEFDSGQSSIRKDALRGVAVIASRFIEDGEELYFNYLSESMTTKKVVEDWLIQPPPVSPYLSKKKITTEVPFFFKLLLGIRDVSGKI